MLNPSNFSLLGFVLCAFAGNSILNRLALQRLDQIAYSIDPSSFTFVRLLSGALMLWFLVILSEKKLYKPNSIHYRGALFLFIYAITFSYAYISLDAAVGALILFGTVQISILSIAIFRGKYLNILEWLGCCIAILGLLVLTLPNMVASVFTMSLSDNNVSSFQASTSSIVLMVVAGIAWGLFTVNGAGSKQPLIDTANCFILSVPIVIFAMIIVAVMKLVTFTAYGIFLAIVSGAITSGLGYAMWYKLLPKLTSSQAASSQLLVPIITSFAGVLILDEMLSLNFILAALLTITGVFLVSKGSSH